MTGGRPAEPADNAAGYIVKTVAKGSPGDSMGLRGGTELVPSTAGSSRSAATSS